MPRHLASWWKDRTGSIGVMFGMLSVLGFTAVAIAIDYGGAKEMRSSLQRDLDAALISAMRTNVETLAEREAIAQTVLNQVYGANGPKVTLKDVDGVTNAFASHVSPTRIGSLVGVEGIAVSVRAAAVIAPPDEFEIALVLDVTQSMDGAKLDNMKRAAKNLASSIMTSENVKVAVAPFARYVNVGVENRGEAGLDIPLDETGTETCTTRDEMEQTNCRTEASTCSDRKCEPYASTCTRDGFSGPCTQTNCTTSKTYACDKQVCDSAPTGKTTTSCQTSGQLTWYGCVGSRKAPYNSENDPAGGGVPGLMNTFCNASVVRLTTELQTVTNAIDALTVADDTYIPAGLMWGWRLLSHHAPFTDGRNPSVEKIGQKVIVLMTDGINTISKTAGAATHSGASRKESDTLLSTVCENVKKDDIQVYTVAYDLNDVDGRALLRDCATNPDSMFFDARDGIGLIDAFGEIVTSFQKVRLSG